MLEELAFYLCMTPVFIVFLMLVQFYLREKFIGKSVYIIGIVCLAIILFVSIGNSSTKKYVYTKKYLVTKNFYYGEETSGIFNDEQRKKMALLADGKRYEVYASDIESRYDFADSKNKKGTTQLVVEIPKIKDSAPNFNKMFFNMSELCEIKVTRNIYK